MVRNSKPGSPVFLDLPYLIINSGYGGRNRARLGWEMMKKRVCPAELLLEISGERGRAGGTMTMARQAARAVAAVGETGRAGLSAGGD
jgi:hypothetical protein